MMGRYGLVCHDAYHVRSSMISIGCLHTVRPTLDLQSAEILENLETLNSRSLLVAECYSTPSYPLLRRSLLVRTGPVR
jgi:hypothetical protein